MSKILLSEKIFASIQGEGRHVGSPSVFMRTFGCNFQCRGFGMSRGKLSTEVDKIASCADKYSKLEEVPLAKTGCDSFISWHPAFKHFAEEVPTRELPDMFLSVIPDREWGDWHLVITGGEPLIGKWQERYIEVLEECVKRGLKNVTFETNGTQPLTPQFKSWLDMASDLLKVTFSISAKLPNSGENFDSAIRPEVVNQYTDIDGADCYFKFVISEDEDVSDIEEALAEYKKYGVDLDVFVMPVGGMHREYVKNITKVANIAMDHGWKYSSRLHLTLFGNSWGT